MCVSGFKSETMINDNGFAITSKFGTNPFHDPITGGVDRRALGCGEIHAGMHFPNLQNGVQANTISGKPADLTLRYVWAVWQE